MNSSEKLLGFVGNINEAVALSYKGGGNRYQVWLDAIQSRYAVVTGQYVGEFDFKVSSGTGFVLIFEKCVFAGMYSSNSTSKLTHAANAAGIGKRNHGRWKIDHQNNLVAGSGLIIQPFPDEIKSLKALIEYLKDDDGIQDGTKFDTKPSKSAKPSTEEASTTSAQILKNLTPVDPNAARPTMLDTDVVAAISNRLRIRRMDERGKCYTSASSFAGVVSVAMDCTDRRNTSLGVYRENVGDISAVNQFLTETKQEYEASGFKCQLDLTSERDAKELDAFREENDGSAYTDMEVGVGSQLRIFTV